MRMTVGNDLRYEAYECDVKGLEELWMFAVDDETGEPVWGECFWDMDEAAQTWVALLVQDFDPVIDGWIPSEGFEDGYRYWHETDLPVAESRRWDGIDGRLGIYEPYLGFAGRSFAALCGLETVVAEVLEEG